MKKAVLRIQIRDPVLFPGSGIRDRKKSGSGYGMNIPDHLSKSLETEFGLKILKYFYADPGSGIYLTLDPGWKNSDPGSG
jgi:hypothetical protein